MALNEIFDGPMGGEAWTHAPGTMPYDRPPQFADLDVALDDMFKRLRRPGVTKKMLNVLETGMPVDILAESLLGSGFTEGRYGAPVLMQMAAPTAVMLWRMAEMAGIEPKLSTDPELKGVDFDPLDMFAAQERISNNKEAAAIEANEKSKKELAEPELADREGFFKMRPEAKSNKVPKKGRVRPYYSKANTEV